MSLPIVNQPAPLSAPLLDQLMRHMRLFGERVLTPTGLRPRHVVALTVIREAGGTTQQGLATALRIDRTNLVGLLNELEGDGLVERRRSPEDRRRHTVELTAAGRDRLARAELALTAMEDLVLRGLDTREREELHDLLRRATAALSCDPPPELDPASSASSRTTARPRGSRARS